MAAQPRQAAVTSAPVRRLPRARSGPPLSFPASPSMRVTTAGQTHAIITRLLSSQSQLADAQARAATGQKVTKVSDDPTAGSAIVRDAGALRGVAQYARNVQSVTASLDAEDTALQQLTDLLTRARQLGLQASTATTDASERAIAGTEVQQLFEQAVNLANTKIGNRYLFGGTTNDGRAPFDATATVFVPSDTTGVPAYPTGVHAIEVGAGGQMLDTAHDGTSVFLSYAAGTPDATRGVLPALRNLKQALDSTQTANIATALTSVSDAFDALQVRVGEIGARQNQAELVSTNLSALQTSLTQHKSNLSEVDLEQAITETVARQTAYQAAMLASSKVLGLSLTEYLR